MMSKFLRRMLGALLPRITYVVLGAVLMLFVGRSLTTIPNPNDEFIVPDLRQAIDCVNYKFPNDGPLVGQICSLENDYVYLYLPEDQYSEHLYIACTLIMKDMLEKREIPQDQRRENCL